MSHLLEIAEGSWPFFLAVFHNCHISQARARWMLSCTKCLRMRPVAIVLNYSVKDVWSNV